MCLKLVLFLLVFMTVKGNKEHLSKYKNAKVSCHNRGGLITYKLLKCSGLINNTCELRVNNSVFKDGESVWVKGRAQIGRYIALHTCMRFSNQDINNFARSRTFHSNILYECSLFCGQIFYSTGFLGIYKDSCYCITYSFRFPHTPECLETGFLDRHEGIIVFRLIRNLQFDAQSKSANFNCLGASFRESGNTSYFNTKCASTLHSICTNRVDSDLSNQCLPRRREFCFNQENNTFLEHYQKCWLYNGTLIPFSSGLTVSLNYPVILGSFRAFKAIEDEGENNGNVTWSCLSITRFNGTIYLETENCSNENKFICMDAIQKTSNKDKSETKDDATTDTKLTYTLSVLIPVIIIIISSSSIAFIILRKRRLRNNSSTTSLKCKQQPSKKREVIPPENETTNEEGSPLNNVRSSEIAESII